MGAYLFLDDGRRVSISDIGGVTVYPDGGFNHRDAAHVGTIERTGSRWLLRRAGREVGSAGTRKEAVLQLLDDAADDLAARAEAARAEQERWEEAVAIVRSVLPDYDPPTLLGPVLVFSPDELFELLDAADEPPDDAELEEEEPFTLPVPDFEDLLAFADEQLGLDLDTDRDALAPLAAIAIANTAWRNTRLEDIHAGNHPRGGFPDADMMRFNIATTRAIAEHVRADGIDWTTLQRLLTDPGRRLPGGTTVAELAQDELPELFDDAVAALWGMQRVELCDGFDYVLLRLAAQASLLCRGWFGTPWWPDVVNAFAELLADPASDAWRWDDGSQPEPPSVADREALRVLLRDHPEQLDDSAIYWCLRHGLSSEATRDGFARWRRRRDPAWRDPTVRPGGA